MYYVSRTIMPVFVFILFVVGLLLIPALNDTAHAQCAISICKSVSEEPDGEPLVFSFSVTQGDLSNQFNLTANSECFGDAFSGSDLEIVEDSKPGWILDNVECSDSDLVDVTFIENGVSLDCLGGTEITCTFTNVRGFISNIPTLSEWGMIAAAGGLALVGVFFVLKRRKAFKT